jgi:hypothetical protein
VIVVSDPPLLNDDAHHTLYGTVTRNGVLVGSYYCADRLRQSDWRIITADGHHVSLDSPPTSPVSESVAVTALTTEHTRSTDSSGAATSARRRR